MKYVVNLIAHSTAAMFHMMTSKVSASHPMEQMEHSDCSTTGSIGGDWRGSLVLSMLSLVPTPHRILTNRGILSYLL